MNSEISRLTVVSREAKKHKARAHNNNKHATTTVMIKTHGSESRGQEAQSVHPQ